jgi:hypothetical protein
LLPDVHILSKLLDALDDENKVTSDFSLIWKNLSSPPNSPFKGMSFSDSLRGSLKVDGTKWKDLPFVESKALHYKK